jgi:G3E family GTPase
MKIPVIIITGFLGSGKTTLLNHLINSDHGLKIAVLVNDFGSINIDAELIVGVEGEDTINLANGCICCTIRDDLRQAALRICRREEQPDALIIETSGVSDPLGVAQTFLYTDLANYTAVDTILTLVDAAEFLDLPAENEVLAMDQVGTADIVVLNKTDLVDADGLATVRQAIFEMVPDARIFETSYGEVPLSLLFGHGAFDPLRFEGRGVHDVHVHRGTAGTADHIHDDHGTVFHTWSYESERPFSLQAIQATIDRLPATIYRAKGILYLDDAPDRRCVLQVVGKRASITMEEGWGEQTPYNRIVLIGAADGLDETALTAVFEASLQENQAEPSPLTTAVNWVRSLFAT